MDTLRKFSKMLFISLAVILHLCLAVLVNFSFPHYDKAIITGGEVKRMDKDGLIDASNPADSPTRDVYFIYTKQPNGDKVMPYRNEDTRWVFPFYFKFNSADLQARAQSFSGTDKTVQVKFYGWRIALFDEFRNAVSIKEINADESVSLPIMSYVFYVILLISLFVCIGFIRKIFNAKIEL
ncbi:MAG: DUF1523 family protein [Campylobacter sp.]|nr:DUF1523 family protein [Campylobacter sp.]